MRQILKLIVPLLVVANFASFAQSPSASNTLSSSGVSSIASTTNANYQLSINGAIYQYGTGITTVTSPTLFLGNTTATNGRKFGINSSDNGLFRIVDITASNADRFTINSNGNVGVGTSTPTVNLQVATPTGASSNAIIGVSNMDYTYSSIRTNSSSVIPPTIGIGNGVGDLGGITWFNDGNVIGTAFSTNQRLLWYGFADANQRYMRLSSLESNFGNFSLEFRNNASTYPFSNTSWHTQPLTSNIVAWNKGLSIGSFSSAPVKIFADAGSVDKVADIFIQNAKIGIGTEAPNSNAKLDVNGNIYCNSKIFIGVADANTQSRINNYSLAVNGEAIFNKARVKLYATWADYVFESNYQLMPLVELEKYIVTNKHLPEIPKAADVEKEGIDIGSTQTILVKKIEELTLYIIEQQKQIESLRADLNKVKAH